MNTSALLFEKKDMDLKMYMNIILIKLSERNLL